MLIIVAMKKADPTEIVDEILKKRQARKEAQLIEAAQLPLWGENRRGLPNVLARSALFNSRRNLDTDDARREFLRGTQIMSVASTVMTYRGEELRQDDSSVFMQLLHLAREQPMGERVYFTAYSMLRALNWCINGPSYTRLRECIERLAANTLKIQMRDGSKGYGKSLVRAFYWKDDVSGETLSRWCIEFEPEILALFGDSSYTLIEWQERGAIGSRSTLALWLHSFLATHREPLPISVKRYHELSASDCQKLFHFRAQLKRALDRLKEIGFVIDYSISEGDLVHIKRRPVGAALNAAKVA